MNPDTGTASHPVGGARRRLTSARSGTVFTLEANGVRALEENPAAVLSELLHPPLVKKSPHIVIVGGVGLPVLLDENGRVLYEIVERRG